MMKSIQKEEYLIPDEELESNSDDNLNNNKSDNKNVCR